GKAQILAAVRQTDLEAARGGILRRAAIADQVGQADLPQVGFDVALLVPVGVELHPSLLLADAAVVLLGIEGRSGEVAFHDGSSFRSRKRSLLPDRRAGIRRGGCARHPPSGAGEGLRRLPSRTRPRRRGGSPAGCRPSTGN